MNTRTKVSMVLSEFFGTTILASLVLAQVNAVGAILSSPWFVAATSGLTMAVLVLAMGRISGGYFNPALSLGLWSARRLPTTTTLVFIASQMLGGIIALILFQYLSNTTVGNIAGSFDWRIFIAELVGMFVFAHGIAAAVFQRLSGFKEAFVVGVSLMLGIIVASTASNGALNPAVALGLNSWSWTYAIAPLLGALLGINVYSLFFAEGMVLAESPLSDRPARTGGTTKTTIVTNKKRNRTAR